MLFRMEKWQLRSLDITSSPNFQITHTNRMILGETLTHNILFLFYNPLNWMNASMHTHAIRNRNILLEATPQFYFSPITTPSFSGASWDFKIWGNSLPNSIQQTKHNSKNKLEWSNYNEPFVHPSSNSPNSKPPTLNLTTQITKSTEEKNPNHRIHRRRRKIQITHDPSIHPSLDKHYYKKLL